jgi:hypothetical protein
VGWNGLGNVRQLLFSVVKIEIFLFGGGGRKEVAICGQVIELDCSAQSPSSLTMQSNGNDVGDGNGSDGYVDKGGRRGMATMAMVTATTEEMAMARRWRTTKRLMARGGRVMTMVTKRAMATAMVARAIAMTQRGQWQQTERAIVTAARAMATAMKRARERVARVMAMATKRAMAMVARLMLMGTKSARTRAGRVMATATRVAGIKDGNG